MRPGLCIGLTGGIGSGKTTVSNLFEELGIEVIDADRITHELQSIGKPAYLKMVELLGPDILDDNNKLRRDYLRKIIFSSPELKQRLEEIVHPLVREEIEKRVYNVDGPYCLISIPLLIESGYNHELDRILVIDLPVELQIARTRQRDKINEEDIRKIINSQVNREKRVELADDIITNDKDLNYLRKQVKLLHNKYLTLTKN